MSILTTRYCLHSFRSENLPGWQERVVSRLLADAYLESVPSSVVGQNATFPVIPGRSQMQQLRTTLNSETQPFNMATKNRGIGVCHSVLM